MSMKYREEEREGGLILHIEGRIDAIAAPLLEESTTQKIDGEGKKFLLFNFCQVEYMSSAGLRLLLSVTKKIKDLSGFFALYDISEEVMGAITLAGFNYILNIYESEEEAITELKLSVQRSS